MQQKLEFDDSTGVLVGMHNEALKDAHHELYLQVSFRIVEFHSKGAISCVDMDTLSVSNGSWDKKIESPDAFFKYTKMMVMLAEEQSIEIKRVYVEYFIQGKMM